ncbi:MAG: tripartite tricarboxylate transporter substrate binding protein BugD, partial [Xanthobacteraceae bacterium]
PQDVLDKIHAATVVALKNDSVKDKLNALGQQISSPELQSPAAFAAFQKAEADKWWPIMKEAGIKQQ